MIWIDSCAEVLLLEYLSLSFVLLNVKDLSIGNIMEGCSVKFSTRVS